MNRRDFLHTTAAAGAAATLASTPALMAQAKGATSAEGEAPAARHQPRLDPNDRRTGRDPLQVQRATLVVEGVANGVGDDYLKLLREGGVNCRVNGARGTQEGYSALLDWLEHHKDTIVLAKSVKEIRQAHSEGKMSQVISQQYADFLGLSFNQPVGSPIPPLRAHHEIGLRVLGLCYNVVNPFGGGCLEGNVGLTRAGRRLVELIHALRIVLDVGGHTGEQTSLDAIAMSPPGIPIICSHTNIAALNDNPRCIGDRLIDAIAATGGVIGITAVSDFMGRSRKDAHLPVVAQVGLDQYLDQLEYLKRRVGVDHIGLGTDNVERVVGPSLGGINREIMTPEMIGEEPWLYVAGFDSIAKLPNVTRGLIQRGWSNAEIHKVLGENLLRVYEKVWGA